jgi:hypothetical protein
VWHRTRVFRLPASSTAPRTRRASSGTSRTWTQVSGLKLYGLSRLVLNSSVNSFGT